MIVGLGAIAVDTVLVTAGHWSEGKGRILDRRLRMGGNVRNALVAAAALGGKTAYLGCLSEAQEWSHVRADLIEHAVDLSFVEWYPGASPIQSTIVVTAEGERFIAFDDSVLASTPMPAEVTVRRAMAAASVLLVDVSTAPEGTLPLMHEARHAGVPIVVDAERRIPNSQLVEEMLSVADHLILPRHFAETLTSWTGDPEDLPVRVHEVLGTAADVVVSVTDGSSGVYARLADSSVEHLPAYPIHAVDTVGCGDVFHGAYAVGLTAGLDTKERLRYASAAAASVAALAQDHDRVPDAATIAALVNAPVRTQS